MVSAKTQYNLKNAQGYFKEHLCVGDYYDQRQQVIGEWVGVGAQKLGLSGRITQADFLRLCEHQDPRTGEMLSQRSNTTRREEGRTVSNRRIFFDFTFSPPKSVSIVGLAAGDTRVVEAHERAVRSALKEFEAFTGTRVRASGQNADRVTGNFVSALFTHDTSRALDPHLHTHCIVFNLTHDAVEQRWKALQSHGLFQAQKFAENAYYPELARELREFGYEIENRPGGDFQIVGVSKELCDRFSKRDAQIDAALEKLLREKPELATADRGALRRHLATAERARKQRQSSPAELRSLWDGQMSPQERRDLAQLREQHAVHPASNSRAILQEAVTWAEEHLFDRHSVVMECQVWQEALGRARGENLTLRDLKVFTQSRGYIRDPSQPYEVTRRDVLLREIEIVKAVRDGAGEVHPLVSHPRPISPQLDEEQRDALTKLLSSTNQVSVFRGGAGTGKSFVLKELVNQAQGAGVEVIVLAPQRQQVVDMESAGFPAPTTVSRFLGKPELTRNTLVVVDEAGQIGGQQMVELLRSVRDANARLLLSGDTRQHGPVEASDALVAIEKHSGVEAVELRTIRRQDPSRGITFKERQQIRRYRSAVEAAAAGRLGESFTRLDAAGLVVACPLGTQADTLAEEYLRLAQTNASAVVVSQTWSEVNRVNEKIRESLKSKGLLGKDEHRIPTLDKLDLTNAQQWYVSISRGRKSVRIFTPDKERLREAVSRSGHRRLAIDLLPSPKLSHPPGPWHRVRGYLRRFGKRAVDSSVRRSRCLGRRRAIEGLS